LKLVHLQFDQGEGNSWFRSSLSEHHMGQLCVVDTRDGLAVGKVDAVSKVTDSKIASKVKPILREATKDDVKKMQANIRKERHAVSVFQNRIQKYKLPMKLVGVRSHFLAKKITFYFTSQERVDFAALVKDLARAFKCRIELRQIGDREKSKRIGGLGPCGNPLCCQSFLKNFEPVTMKMAKEQELPLDSSKLGGMCGKLLCCLRYELPLYKEKKKKANN